MTNQTEALLTELQTIDDREDQILDVLLRHGAALEESERRANMVSIADLRVLSDSLAGLEGVIDRLQADVRVAEAAALPAPAEQPAIAAAAAQPPTREMTFAQLESQIRKNETEAAQVKEILRERLLVLDATPHDPGVPAVPALDVAAPVVLPAGPTFRLSNPPMKSDEIKRFQRQLNARFEKWDINIRLDEDGVYGMATRHAARQVLLGLGVSPAEYEDGVTPRLRALIVTPSIRTALELEHARDRRPWLKRLRAREADASDGKVKHATNSKRASSSAKHASAAPAGSVAAAIRSHGGRYEDIIVREAKRQGLPIALVCAVVECESTFKNIYGHDGVRNPIKSPPKGLLEVTAENYRSYLKHRKAKEGCQGVGPMQLTSSGLQDRADDLGGCWTPSANIRVGCEFLAGNIKRLSSKRQGIRAYNGSGPAAERYASTVLNREAVWATRLAGAKVTTAAKPAPSHEPAAGKGTPRTFRLTKKPMSGKDVKRFQHDLNARFAIWKIHSRISEDGDYGAATRQAARQVLTGLGIASADFEAGIAPQLRSTIRNPSLRTPTEIARSKSREDYVGKLRKRLNAKGGGALRLRAYAEAKHLSDKSVREVGGNNSGKMVMEIIRANGGPGPEPWCGDFVAWCYRKAGSNAVTRQWASVKAVGGLGGVKRTSNPMKGDLVRFTFDHIGMYVCWCDSAGREVSKGSASHIKTIEGNTGRSGAVAVNDSASGADGVYTKVRPRNQVNDFLHIAR